MNGTIAYYAVAGTGVIVGIYLALTAAWNKKANIAIHRVLEPLGWGNTLTTEEISRAIHKSERKTQKRLWDLLHDGKVSHSIGPHNVHLWGPVRHQQGQTRFPGRF